MPEADTAPDAAQPAAAPDAGVDKSELVAQVMERCGTPSYDAWAMSETELIQKLEA